MRSGWATAVAITVVGLAAFAPMGGAGDRPPVLLLPLIFIVAAIPAGLGLLLARRRPDLMVGALITAFGVVPLVVFGLQSWGATASWPQPWPGARAAAVVSTAAWMWFFVPPALLSAVFPGAVLTRRTRWLCYGWPIVLAGFPAGVAFDPGTYRAGGGSVPGPVPDLLPRVAGTVIAVAALAGFAVLLAGSVTVLVLRYRRGRLVLRRQIRWLALSALVLPAALLLAWLCYLLLRLPGVAGVVVVAGLLVVFIGMPLGTVIAVLRHDLYDIDRLVSRTVSYAVITALLAVLFAAVVLLAGLVVGRRSAPAAALATLCCALVFGRLRHRVQRAVDRRFDRDGGRAAAEVARFVGLVRDGRAEPEGIETALADALRDQAVRVAYALTSPAGSPLWLTAGGKRVSRPDEPAREIRSQRRLLAVVGLGAASASRPALLAEVLREAHLPLELTRSRIEVRAALAETEASRARLVRAGYEERRRLERDLHDGAQQRLVAIGLSLRLAQRHLAPGLANATLDAAVAELQEAVKELRRISQGVRPSGLDDGLPAALRTLVRASPVPVELRVTAEQVQDTVATTAYYVAAEAVANALKHAEPRRVVIEITREADMLKICVSDDGCGGARIVPGRGLGGLADRVSASGGTLQVDSPAGAGTTVRVLLPCVS
jgi:signal transduction histidine kinase